MSFPIPGDAIEQNLDLNQLVIKNTAATFFMRVADNTPTDGEVQPGDVLVVDRSLSISNTSSCDRLVVAIIDGEFVVLRVHSTKDGIVPVFHIGHTDIPPFEVWGVVTTIIRSV